MLALHAVAQTPPRSNVFNDPFGPATSALPACPTPEGPLWTDAEARQEQHWRSERGTSCYQSGRCRLPNAYLYDREIYPRVLRFIAQDARFADSSLWITVQRRWVWVQGCVQSVAQGQALEAALRGIDDVEAVVPQWMVGAQGQPPYPVAPLR